MPFVRGQPEDEQIHERYHRAIMGGIDYPGYKNEVNVAFYQDPDSAGIPPSGIGSNNSTGTGSGASGNSRIVMVSMSDTGKPTVSGGTSSFEKKKVKEVLQLVNKELGSVDFDPEQLDSCKVFLYISGRKKVIGCAIAERIKQGFCIIPSATTDANAIDGSSDSVPVDPVAVTMGTRTSTLAAKTAVMLTSTTATTEHASGSGSAIFCGTEPQPAICGINRIWVSSHHRRRKIASRLLDAIRDRFIYACKLELSDLAFSQPTGDGKALARQYLGTDRFLVYVE